jgi:DNA polymerase IV
MDAFYASVEQLDNPQYKGKPVIVGGDSLRGVVSAASYEARKFGVFSAMPAVTARKKCPHGIFVPVRMERYQEISRCIHEIFFQFTPLVEPLSLDEAFLDVTDSERLFGPAPEIAARIREMVKSGLNLTVSAGVASSKLVAKIASDHEKPDGLTVVLKSQEKDFLAALPIERLWGVGKSTRKKLALLGVKKIVDLQRLPRELLEHKFGKSGGMLHERAHGIDPREVTPERQVKSVGNEVTLRNDLTDLAMIKKILLSLALKVGSRLRKKKFKGLTITIKIKFFDFSQVTRSISLKQAVDDSMEIYFHGKQLLKKTAAGKKPVRLVGVSVSKLDSKPCKKQLSLFQEEQSDKNRSNLNLAIDQLNEQFGKQIVKPGTLVNYDKRSR